MNYKIRLIRKIRSYLFFKRSLIENTSKITNFARILDKLGCASEKCD